MQFKSSSGETDKILVSFHSKWADIFIKDPPSVVFRLRVPIQTPTKLYIYASAPLCAIIGVCEIKSVERLKIKAALALSKAGRIDETELRSYIGKYADVGVFRIGKVKIAKKYLSLDQLRSKGRFFPPQSFLFISDEGGKLLDSLM